MLQFLIMGMRSQGSLFGLQVMTIIFFYVALPFVVISIRIVTIEESPEKSLIRVAIPPSLPEVFYFCTFGGWERWVWEEWWVGVER